jgi:signal transduction histidine kinase
MTPVLPASMPSLPNSAGVLAYLADLELEVDRLRKHGQFVQHVVRNSLKRIHALCADPAGGSEAMAAVDQTTKQLAAVLRDLQEPPGYHPAHDQVIAIAVRPLLDQVFRWQQRLLDAPKVTLRLELGSEHVEWFPARLRHILDNLISNSVKYHDPGKDESWVQVVLEVDGAGYHFRVSDNGVGLPEDEHQHIHDLFYRAAPARAAGLGVGLAVVKLLVEQSGGELTVNAGQGQGTSFVVLLPRYEIDDFLT